MPMQPLELPGPHGDWAQFVDDLVECGLADARRIATGLKDGAPRSAHEVLDRWNDSSIAVSTAGGVAGLLAQVHPEVEVRTRSEAALQELAKFGSELSLDKELYAVFAAVDGGGLDPEAARLLAKVLRDFRRSGVDRDDATRDRLKAIDERLTVLGQDFSRIIRDDVRTIRIAPERLDGLPKDYVDAHPPGDDGLVAITTDYPDLIPFTTFAHDGAARRELHTAFLNRGWPDNDPVLHEILDLRHEMATLLGYPDWAAYDAEVKMIGTGEAIGEFIERITDLADAPGRRDLAVLLARARQDDPGIEALTAADNAYYSELVRREDYEVDAQEVRRYFDFAKVSAGLLDVTGRLFGVSYRPRDDAPVWHEAVTAYDVLRGDEMIGRIYLDLHPREGKFKHAAQFGLVSGVAGRDLPEGALVCNFPTGLMEHTDVVTLFHEFGHLVHHVLGGAQRWVRFSGVATEWDFVEAPSQMLEEWAWDANVLRSFATDADGVAIPGELVAKMVAAHEFGKGRHARTQMFYAATSLGLHRDRPADHTAYVAELQERYDLLAQLPDTHFQAAFGHLDGYGSGYYTYMWSLVIAKDMFSAFDGTNLFDPKVAERYRDRVLAQGGRADAADLVADFLGQPYSFDTFGEWLAR
ncbi:Thimet oligopeptidase [Nostocoides australiense Ben110]|uniref:Thimet oligopeptidase n=1 Tax=Nostocoides australiense Ben110 TaxID=1193182 RepID=W6JVJ5_9MICO|nr:M3 family metallopeptidase [Tetrasphaera australiensis]CCH73022.1 Thimet oligopeptidase [Tetrasphaera australiensis Ben110]